MERLGAFLPVQLDGRTRLVVSTLLNNSTIGIGALDGGGIRVIFMHWLLSSGGVLGVGQGLVRAFGSFVLGEHCNRCRVLGDGSWGNAGAAAGRSRHLLIYVC